MIELMIVDDEILTVDVLQSQIPWKQLGVDRLHAAHSMRQACDMLSRHSVDILVCDIEMPQGSGLALVEWMRARQLETAVIFLTGHESFAYASQAIRLRSLEYLVKPVPLETLADAVRRAIEIVRLRRHDRAFIRYGENWHAGHAMLIDQFWMELLTGAIPPNAAAIFRALESRRISMNPSMRFRLVLAAAKSDPEDATWNRWDLEFAAKNILAELLSAHRCAPLTLDRRHMALVLPAPEADAETGLGLSPVESERSVSQETATLGASDVARPAEAARWAEAARPAEAARWAEAARPAETARPEAISPPEDLLSACNAACLAVHRHLSLSIGCYVGRPVHMAELPDQLRRLRELESRHVTGDRRVMTLDAPRAAPPSYRRPELGAWRALLLEFRTEALVRSIREWLEAAAKDGEIDGTSLRRFRQDFLQMVYAALAQHDLSADDFFVADDETALYDQSILTVEDMVRLSAHVAEKAVRHAKAGQHADSVEEKVRRFVRANLHADISREDIVKIVNLSPEYLSRLFRRSTGLSLTEYIQKEKVAEACRLLRETELPVSEISLRLGYGNFAHFSQIFKRFESQSPLAWRKSRRHE